MEERGYSSQRAFARDYNLPRQTFRRLLSGQRVDPESLQQIAESIGIPIDVFYRLCGYLPEDETRNRLLQEISLMLSGLEDEQQRRMQDLIREEVARLKEQDDDEKRG